MNLSKEISLTLAVLVVLGGGGFFVNSILGKPSNPEVVVKAALGNAFAESAKHTETTAKIVVGSSAAELKLVGDTVDADKLLPTSDYQLQLSGDLLLDNQLAKVSGGLNFRFVDKDIYFQLINPTITGSSEKIPAVQSYLNGIQGKWLALPLQKLTEENTEIAKAITEKTTAQQNLRTKLQTTLSNSSVFTVKKASGSFIADEYYITVIPNFREILSDDMVDNLAKLLGQTTTEETAQLKATLTAAQPEITLTISRSENLFLGYETILQAGETTLTLENTVEKLNEIPAITPPENSEVFDAEAFQKVFTVTP